MPLLPLAHPPVTLSASCCLSVFFLRFLILTVDWLLFVFVLCHHKILDHITSSCFLICALLPGSIWGGLRSGSLDTDWKGRLCVGGVECSRSRQDGAPRTAEGSKEPPSPGAWPCRDPLSPGEGLGPYFHGAVIGGPQTCGGTGRSAPCRTPLQPHRWGSFHGFKYHHSTGGSVLPFTPIVGIQVSWLVGDSAPQISG